MKRKMVVIHIALILLAFLVSCNRQSCPADKTFYQDSCVDNYIVNFKICIGDMAKSWQLTEEKKRELSANINVLGNSASSAVDFGNKITAKYENSDEVILKVIDSCKDIICPGCWDAGSDTDPPTDCSMLSVESLEVGDVRLQKTENTNTDSSSLIIPYKYTLLWKFNNFTGDLPKCELEIQVHKVNGRFQWSEKKEASPGGVTVPKPPQKLNGEARSKSDLTTKIEPMADKDGNVNGRYIQPDPGQYSFSIVVNGKEHKTTFNVE